MVKYIEQKQQQKQQRQQHKNLLWQFIQLSIHLPLDAYGLSIHPTPKHPSIHRPRLGLALVTIATIVVILANWNSGCGDVAFVLSKPKGSPNKEGAR